MLSQFVLKDIKSVSSWLLLCDENRLQSLLFPGCLPHVDFFSLTFFTPHFFPLVEAGTNRICLALFCDVRQTRATTNTGWSRAIHFLCTVRAATNRGLGLFRYFVFSLSLSRKAGGAITTVKMRCLYFHPHSRHCVIPLRCVVGPGQNRRRGRIQRWTWFLRC